MAKNKLIPGVRVKLISLRINELPQITPVNVFIDPSCKISKILMTIREKVLKMIKEIGTNNAYWFGSDHYTFTPADGLYLTTITSVCLSTSETIGDLALNKNNIDAEGFLVIRYMKESTFG